MKIYFYEWEKLAGARARLQIEPFFGCPDKTLIRRLKLKSSSGYGATIISVPSGEAKVKRPRMITSDWRSFLLKSFNILMLFLFLFLYILALCSVSSVIRCAVMCVIDNFQMTTWYFVFFLSLISTIIP